LKKKEDKMSRLRTSDVVQVRKFGRNYIVLGKAMAHDGVTQEVVVVKNGMIKKDGTVRKMRRGHRTDRPTVLTLDPKSIIHIHGRRTLDLNDAKAKLPGVAAHCVRMDATSGLDCPAPSIGELQIMAGQLSNLD
jgi:hypothetical protein